MVDLFSNTWNLIICFTALKKIIQYFEKVKTIKIFAWNILDGNASSLSIEDEGKNKYTFLVECEV